MYKAYNDYTKQSMIDTLNKEFTGKAYYGGSCSYLTEDGKKCAVGCFIPDGHEAQNLEDSAEVLVRRYPDLELPLSKTGLLSFQRIHDLLLLDMNQEDQLHILIDWINTNVVD